ncbi:MAG: DEAD/DEAH box helicase [Candidatus Aenigmarchaeota archaeon]|nr:DEAD/DEAH box helicase [Candidatus Aenigmarchaeota archaeon]
MEYVFHPWINQGTMEKREYQEHIAKRALDGNMLCVLPTGIGKTPIAVLVAVERMAQKNGKVLMMAPTRPLVNQHRKTFEHFLKIGPEYAVVTGLVMPEKRKELYEKNDVIFSTPQTIRNDLKSGLLSLDDFALLVVDEAHRAVRKYSYTFVAKKYMEQSRHPLILALTASPGGVRYRIDEICEKLSIENVEIRTRDDEDVRPYVQDVEHDFVKVMLPENISEIRAHLEMAKDEKIQKLMTWGFIHTPIINKSQIIGLQAELAKKKSGSSFMAMSFLAEILKIDHALVLLETQCIYALKKYLEKLQQDAQAGKTKAVVRLVKDGNFRLAAELTEKLYNEGKEHPKIERLKEIVEKELSADARIMIFAQFRDTISKIREVLSEIPECRRVEFIGQAKKAGKGLSQAEQIGILNDFKLGTYNVLVASQIGEEGLSIEETDSVIFYEGVPSAIRKIQRAGRVARTRPGKIIILLTKGTRDEAYYWTGYHKERKMKKILEGMQNKTLKGFG